MLFSGFKTVVRNSSIGFYRPKTLIRRRGMTNNSATFVFMTHDDSFLVLSGKTSKQLIGKQVCKDAGMF